MTRPFRALAGAIVLVLALAGCTASTPSSDTWTPGTGGVPSSLQPFYGQRISWHSCASGFECATAVAPLDWSAPGGTRIHLALTRLRATGHRIGSLFVNPGGPGASAVDWLQGGAKQEFDASLRKSYDLVAWDPRGVGHSSAVECYDTAQLDGFTSDDPNLPEGSAALAAHVQSVSTAFGRACAQKTGALLAHIDTVSTVKDLDMLRAASGAPRLDYFGFSYGTAIGAEYADLFPRKVGRLVLDGALDPQSSDFEVNLAQTRAFGDALKTYLAACIPQASCPFHGETVAQAVSVISSLLLRLRQTPVRTTDGRVVNSAVMHTAIDAALYDKDNWKYLTQAFSRIGSGDGSVALALNDFYNDRTSKGYTDNLIEAFEAIRCVDTPVATDPATLASQGRQIDAVDPLRAVDNTNSLGDPICANWPVKPVGSPHRITATGSPAILVLGTTGDPATPYQWAVSLAKQLPKGVLLTFRGQGHTAYHNDDPCINTPVDTYLVSGTVPAARTCG